MAHRVLIFPTPPRIQGAAEVENVLTESLRIPSQDALASHQSLRSIVGFVKRDTATLVSKAWRTARNQQTTRVKCHHTTDAAVLALAEHCPNLTKIFLTDCADITEKAKAALRKSHEGIKIYG